MPIGNIIGASGNPPIPAPRNTENTGSPGSANSGRTVLRETKLLPSQTTGQPAQPVELRKRDVQAIANPTSARDSLNNLLSELSMITDDKGSTDLLQEALEQELQQLERPPERALKRQGGIRSQPESSQPESSEPSEKPLQRRLARRIPSPVEAAIYLSNDLPLAEVKSSAQLANYAYDMNLEALNTNGSSKVTVAPERVINNIKDLLHATYKNITCNTETGQIIDKTTGLSAFILHNTANNTVYLIAGGTTSGQHAGNLTERSVKNAGMTVQQWCANARNALLPGKSGITEAAKQTKDIATALLGFTHSTQFFSQKSSVALIGHSKGGSDALHAFAQNCTGPLAAKHCITFCSAKPGDGIISAIAKDARATIKKRCFNIVMQGDVVPKLGRGALQGKVTEVPCTAGPLNAHVKFNQYIQSTAGPLNAHVKFNQYIQNMSQKIETTRTENSLFYH